MTITVSNKEAVLLAAVALGLYAFSLSVSAFRGEKAESVQPKTVSNPGGGEIESVGQGKNFTIAGIPHPSCYMKLYYGALNSPSTTFNGNNPYNISFMGGFYDSKEIESLQDINGDNLPDYIYEYNHTGPGSTQISSTHIACIYLNNGNGWSKAYECFAQTSVDNSGNVIDHRYFGDCAGPAK